MILMGYCGLMKMQHGEFSVTAVSYINNTVTAINSNSYKYATNQEMINTVDKIKGDRQDGDICWTVYSDLKEKYTVDELKEFANSSLKNDPNYKKFLITKTVNLGFLNIGTAGYVTNKAEYSNINYTYLGNLILPINFAFVYIIMIVSMVYLIWKFIKYKELDWLISFFTLLIIANLFTLIVGAPFESQRLFLTSIVSIVLLIGKILAMYLQNNGNRAKEVTRIMNNDIEKKWLYKLFLQETEDVKIQFFRYLFVGGFAAVVNIGSLYIFKEFLHIHYLVANILGFVLGLITNYLLSKWLVFAKEKNMNSIIEFIIYTIIGVIGLGLDTLFIWIFTDKLNVFYMLSKIISTGLVFIWNFFGRKGIYIIAKKIRKGE